MNRACASPEDMRRMLSGECDAGWVEMLGAHVEECALCQQALDEVMRSTSSPGAAVGLQRPALSPGDDALLARVRNTTRAGDGDTEVAPDGLPDVPGFVVEALLGIGGQGAVVRARQLRLGGRLVALKLIGVQSRMLFREHLARFQIEAEAFARLVHPNIVRIYEIAEHDSLPYLVLEYVEGGTLSEKLERGPLAPRDAVRLLATIARAVHYAHSQGVIHRDLKPRNILLTRDGDPKISDFGLAGFVESGSGLQHANRGLGTKEYMSPEQWSRHRPFADARSDQWSLGVILYEMLCGRRPFAGESSETIARAIRESEPAPLRAVARRDRADLEAICRRCLCKDPDARYPSCEHLAEDLRRWERGEPVAARPVPVLERFWKWSRRNPTKAGLWATIGIAAACLPFAAMWHTHRLQQSVTTTRIETLIDSLVNADLSRAPQSLRELSRCPANNVESMILVRLQESADEPEVSLKLRLALLTSDSSQARHILDGFLISRGSDGSVLLELLGTQLGEFIEPLWESAVSPANDSRLRLRAACALAQCDHDSLRWEQIIKPVAEWLIQEDPESFSASLALLNPIRASLLPQFEAMVLDFYDNHLKSDVALESLTKQTPSPSVINTFRALDMLSRNDSANSVVWRTLVGMAATTFLGREANRTFDNIGMAIDGRVIVPETGGPPAGRQ